MKELDFCDDVMICYHFCLILIGSRRWCFLLLSSLAIRDSPGICFPPARLIVALEQGEGQENYTERTGNPLSWVLLRYTYQLCHIFMDHTI